MLCPSLPSAIHPAEANPVTTATIVHDRGLQTPRRPEEPPRTRPKKPGGLSGVEVLASGLGVRTEEDSWGVVTCLGAPVFRCDRFGFGLVEVFFGVE